MIGGKLNSYASIIWFRSTGLDLPLSRTMQHPVEILGVIA